MEPADTNWGSLMLTPPRDAFGVGIPQIPQGVPYGIFTTHPALHPPKDGFPFSPLPPRQLGGSP